METLDDVLLGKEPDEVVEEPEAKGEVEDKTETPEAEESEAGPTAAETPESEKREIPIAALLDEREKRQAAQKRAEELEQQLAELAKKPDEKAPSVFEDEEGAFRHLEAKLEDARLQDRIDMSREFMSMFKDDYDAREQQFLELAKGDAELVRKLRSHPNPAKFAYETAEKHERLSKMENLDEWEAKERARLREEVKAELKAELESEHDKDVEKRESLTPSLAKGHSAGGNTPVEDDLGSILTNVG